MPLPFAQKCIYKPGCHKLVTKSLTILQFVLWKCCPKIAILTGHGSLSNDEASWWEQKGFNPKLQQAEFLHLCQATVLHVAH